MRSQLAPPHVAFAHPIPIPGTHRRQADFASADGWIIEDDEGRIVISDGRSVRFYTYVSASCVEDLAPTEGLGESLKRHTSSDLSDGGPLLGQTDEGASVSPPAQARKRKR